MTSKEFEFFVKVDLGKYSGKYVAIVEDKVVASGNNAKKVLEDAKKKFPDKIPTLAKIPKEETLIFHSEMLNKLLMEKNKAAVPLVTKLNPI